MHARRFFSAIPSRLWKCVLVCTVLIGLGAAAVRIIDLVEFGFVVGPIIGDSNIIEDSAQNGRADKVKAVTDTSGGWKDPDSTEIRLRRAHHWLWISLFAAESFGVHVDLKWRNDDALDVTLGFGCLTHMTRPVDKVGSIRISYHFSYDDKTLAKSCPD